MLIREYHGFTVISAREEEPSKDGDGWDHAVVLKDGSVMAPFGTLAEAIQVCKLAAEKAEEDSLRESNQRKLDEANALFKASMDDAEQRRIERDRETVAEAPITEFPPDPVVFINPEK